MNDASKVKPSHIQRTAFVYIRRSSPAQVEYNRESTARQYALVEKACELGWAKEQVTVIDEDLGVSGSGFAERSGFARMTAEVAPRPRRHRLRAGSLPRGAQQCRLVSPLLLSSRRARQYT
jgi:Resolvase, N terminal domain